MRDGDVASRMKVKELRNLRDATGVLHLSSATLLAKGWAEVEVKNLDGTSRALCCSSKNQLLNSS